MYTVQHEWFVGEDCLPCYFTWNPLAPDTWAEHFESFERINSIRETNRSFDYAAHVNGWEPASRLHDLHELRAFLASKLSVQSFRIFMLMYPGSLTLVLGSAVHGAIPGDTEHNSDRHPYTARWSHPPHLGECSKNLFTSIASCKCSEKDPVASGHAKYSHEIFTASLAYLQSSEIYFRR